MAQLACHKCNRETIFHPIYRAAKIAGVSRATIYNWMQNDLVHWRVLPSGRRVICENSLSAGPQDPQLKFGRRRSNDVK